nr:hypothetical protein [uncultured Halomonas sp.]
MSPVQCKTTVGKAVKACAICGSTTVDVQFIGNYAIPLNDSQGVHYAP